MTIGRPEVVRLPKGSARRAAPIGALLSRVGQGLNHEEIGSPDGLGVVGKEGTPALAGRPGWPAARVTANGACADGDAALKRGRPRERPDRQRQNRRQPWRCHRRVSGRTKTRSPRQFRWRRRTKSQKSLSRARRRGRCRERRATWSCGRRSRFSMRRRWRLRRTLAVWRGRAREVRSSGGRIADRCSPAGRSADFCPPTTLAGLQQP